eukprot:UN28669
MLSSSGGKTARGTRYLKTNYYERQRRILIQTLRNKCNRLNFSERMVTQIMNHVDRFFTSDIKVRNIQRKFKTIGTNKNCLRVCCCLLFLMARHVKSLYH